MITGDHQTTAEAIAKQLGMIPANGVSMSGQQIARLSDDELDAKVNDTYVYARVSPEHKLRIVKSLQRKGHVVAMTGDGVNDAPAIKAADIGIAMGITGTDVSKEASSLILSDDNFSTIVAAIEEGRGIYENIRKFIRYLLASNVGEIMTMFIAMMAGLPLAACTDSNSMGEFCHRWSACYGARCGSSGEGFDAAQAAFGEGKYFRKTFRLENYFPRYSHRRLHIGCFLARITSQSIGCRDLTESAKRRICHFGYGSAHSCV